MEHKELSHYAGRLMIVVFALLTAGCETKKGEVRGTFVDRDGEPLSETITVTLMPLTVLDDGRVVWSVEYQFTDEFRQRWNEMVITDGKFLFENVEPGPYWIETERSSGRPITTSPAFELSAGGVVDFGEIVVD
jgi:hypothetical protein